MLKIHRRFSLESLERRSLLAGNVTGTVSDGLLTITGDSAGNRIYIRQLDPIGPANPWPGARYEIADLYPAGRPVTTVNGQSSAVVEGVKNGMYLNLGEGSDFVNISRPGAGRNAAMVPGKLAIDMSGGGDTVKLFVVNRKEVVVRLGLDGDAVSATGEVNVLNITTDGIWANAPGGDDRVQLSSLTVKQSATVNTGGRDDEVQCAGATLDGPLAIDTDGGVDNVHCTVTTTSAAATVNIKTGDQSDKIFFGNLFAASNLKSEVRIDTGKGDDYLEVLGFTSTGHVNVNTGSGADYLLLRDATVDSVLVWMGDEDDLLYIDQGVFANTSDLGGGRGNDTLEFKADTNSNLGDSAITGFEIQK